MTIDSRQKITCACGCQREATMPHFRVMDLENVRLFVLPGCWDAFSEELAARLRLREIITRHQTPLARLRKVVTVYRMQRRIHARKGAIAAHQTARRSAIVYLFGQTVGLILSSLWTTKSSSSSTH